MRPMERNESGCCVEWVASLTSGHPALTGVCAVSWRKYRNRVLKVCQRPICIVAILLVINLLGP